MTYKIKSKKLKEKKQKELSYSEKQNKLKKVEWENPNKMKFDSPFKTFNKQTRVISTGNAIHDTQFSFFIRPKTEMECNNAKFDVGHLRDTDLGYFGNLPYDVRKDVEQKTETKPAILYQFKHYQNGRIIVDGYVLTDTNYKHLKTYYTNQNNKSIGAVEEAKKYISWGG
jgi:hypothetical protein